MRLPALLSFPLALLLAVAAAGAIFLPAVYARENPYWAAQGLGQDWVDLVLVAPLLAWLAFRTLRGGRLAALLLCGALVYALYSLVLYAFFVHFGPLFLVYAAALGLAFYAVVTLAFALTREDVRGWFGDRPPARLAGAYTVGIGGVFALLWLGEVIPATLSGAMLKSAEDAGLITNPVELLDLGIVLPAFVVGGVALMRGRAVGYWLVPVLLGFGVVMDLGLAGMSVSMAAKGFGGGPPTAALLGLAAATGGVLWAMLRRVR